jgi:hypothetical protein
LTQLVNHATVFKVRLANIGGQLELDYSVPLIFDTDAGGDHWHDVHGIEGNGADDVAVIDTGINFGDAGLNSHRGASESFFGQQGLPNDQDGHGTMIAGVIASGHHSRTGVAPEIDKLINAKVTNNAVTILIAEDAIKEALQWAIQGDTAGPEGAEQYAAIGDEAEIVNFSHGWDKVSQENTDYTQVARDFDRFVDDDLVSITKSAGNQGPPARTITVPADAYNIIVVAAMHNTNLNRADDSILSSSSRGPTRGNSSGTDTYERKKPDLTAPGFYITTKDHNGAWKHGIGTSMAAAHVAGAIALLRDAGPTSPIDVKAVLINTADDWGSFGWDSTYGWGYINLDNAWDHRWDSSIFHLYPNGQSGCSAYLKGTMQMGDKATAVWNRHEDENDDRLNDIDLWIYKYDTEESDTIGDALAWSITTVNNVEQVVMPAVAAQEVIIEVRCVSSSLAGGISSERVAVAYPSGFSLYTLPGAAPPIQSASSEPNRTEVGQSFPNPLNPETWIPYTLSEDANVAIDIYDARGQLVRTLNLGVKSAGRYLTQATAAHWDGRNSTGERVASGPYFYYFQAGDFKATRKLMVLK